MAPPRPAEPLYYLTAADLVRCHAAAVDIALSTARNHLINRAGLLSALARPRWHAIYRHADLVDQAAVLYDGLAHAHAWIDGNKRTAWVATVTFLEINGRRVRPTRADDVVGWLAANTSGRIGPAELAEWLRSRTR